MRIVICISLIGTLLLAGLAYSQVTRATHTATKDMNGNAATPDGTPGIFPNASAEGMTFILNRSAKMFGASQSAGSIRHWGLTTLPSEPNMPFPPYLVGGDMVKVNNENRGLKDYQLFIETDQPSYVYLVMENRVNGSRQEADPNGDPNDVLSQYSDPDLDESPDAVIPNWLVDKGWVRMNTGNNATAEYPDAPDFVSHDEGADGSLNRYAAIYKNVTEPNLVNPGYHTITLGAQGLGNMYAVIVFPTADLDGDGIVDVDDMQAFAEDWLKSPGNKKLAHRYTFDENGGTTIHDVVGGKHGTIVNVSDPAIPGSQFYAWSTAGRLSLLNRNDQKNTMANGGSYVQLPANVLDDIHNDDGVTFEIFYQETGTDPTKRGNDGASFFYFSETGNQYGDWFEYIGDRDYDSTAAPPRTEELSVMSWFNPLYGNPTWDQVYPNTYYHRCVAVVVDNVANKVFMYMDGQYLIATLDYSLNPSQMPGFKSGQTFDDLVNYLGRGRMDWNGSAYVSDRALANVDFDAFNIYGFPMTAAQVLASYNATPDQSSFTGCKAYYKADLDNDCDVDLEDFAELASAWMKSSPY